METKNGQVTIKCSFRARNERKKIQVLSLWVRGMYEGEREAHEKGMKDT